MVEVIGRISAAGTEEFAKQVESLLGDYPPDEGPAMVVILRITDDIKKISSES